MIPDRKVRKMIACFHGCRLPFRICQVGRGRSIRDPVENYLSVFIVRRKSREAGRIRLALPTKHPCSQRDDSGYAHGTVLLLTGGTCAISVEGKRISRSLVPGALAIQQCDGICNPHATWRLSAHTGEPPLQYHKGHSGSAVRATFPRSRRDSQVVKKPQ